LKVKTLGVSVQVTPADLVLSGAVVGRDIDCGLRTKG
jgi:hypothetical protein